MVSALLILIVSLSVHAQDNQPSSQQASSKESEPAFSKKELTKRGFTFDDRKQPMCQISGPDGPCEVEAFVFGETNNDKDAHTCRKLDKSSYVGRCVQGKLQGLSVVLADGEKKQIKEGFISYFHEGHVAYPILTSYLEKDLNFGAREQQMSYGCVYFGKFDRREEKCKRFIQIYGPEIFTEANATALRNGTFDLAPYRANFVKFMQSKEEPAPLAPVPAILQRLRSH
jgi:hypothetical protein